MTAFRTAMTRVFVSGLKVQAEIGVYRHEIGRVQPLVVDVELDVPTAGSQRLSETLNYETILAAPRRGRGRRRGRPGPRLTSRARVGRLPIRHWRSHLIGASSPSGRL